MQARRVALIAASVIIGVGILAPVARAGGGLRFTAPLSNGTVDFGDRVLYRLEGAGCAGAKVEIRVGGDGRPEVAGPTSHAARDPLAPGSCVGIAQVPSESAVRQTGWDDGDRLEILVLSKDAPPVALTYQRVEVDHGEAVPEHGALTVGPPSVPDPRSSARDAVASMQTGDVVKLGVVDLTHIHSISLRVCVTVEKPHVTPSFVELRAGGPDAPSIIGRVDVADDVNNSNKANFGWPNCWQLQSWPIINKVPGRAPELFLAMVATAAPVEINFIDFNGTGTKVPDTPPTDPAGMQQIFDGTTADGKDFVGWDQTNCTVDGDGSVRGVHTTDPQNYAPLATFGFVGEDGCTMTYTKRTFDDAVFRFEYRLQDFGDNGAVYVGGHEIQLREAGEWMTGGLLGTTLPDALTNFAMDNPATGYPVQRIKSNSYPEWSQMEIVLVGTRYVVRINGRTVTDCLNCFGDPPEFSFRFATQPGFSYHYGVGWRMDTGPTNPVTDDPSNWGNISFRNFRVFDCTKATHEVCHPGPKVLRD